MTPLERLRAELDTVDGELLSLVGKRLDIVRRIGAVKRGDDTPLFDRAREQIVRAQAQRRAAAAGVDTQTAEALMGTLLEASHRLQASAIEGAAEAPRAMLIIGGAGRMGQCLARAFEGRGHSVDSYDLGDERALRAVVEAAEVVLVAVPMRAAVQVVEQVAPWVGPDALLCDINSLKTAVCGAMAACGGEALGLHPMFGPSVGSLRRQKVVCCSVKPGPLGVWMRRELAQLGCELVESTPDAHDRMMAVVQVLVHFRTLVTGAALRKFGVDIHDSLRFTSPIYRLELAFCGRLFAQDPELYATIEMSNPHGTAARAIFVEAAAELLRIIETGDRAAFREAFEATARFFDDFKEASMALSDHIIESLVGRP